MIRTFYHRTNHAAAIVAEGFLDGEGRFMFEGLAGPLRGVWVSDRPLDAGSRLGTDKIVR